ncbi:response regulator [soil metagenome]
MQPTHHDSPTARPEEPVRESEHDLRQFAMGSDDVFWLADVSSAKLLFVNAAFERIWAVPPSLLQADPSIWRAQVLEADRQMLPTPFFAEHHADSSQGDTPPVREYRIRTPDGEIRWIHDRRFLLKDEAGATVRIGGIAEDVTERKNAEFANALLLTREREARAQAEALALSKDEFLSVVSHELRSPLNAIRGWAYVLRQVGGLTPVQDRALNAIDRNTQAQARVVDDLLDSQRILLGTFSLELHQALLSTVVDEAVEEVRHAAAAKKIEIATTHDPSIRLVSVDVRRLRQALANLLSNAVKFTPDRGSVAVTTRRVAGGIEVSVADSGIGIDEAHLPLVFDRFRQADASNTRRQGGLGLGLSLTRQLIELHGGRIAAHSAGTDKGATFTIWLSDAGVVDSPSEPNLLSTETSDSFPLEGRKIMVVEDDVDSREMLELILRDTHADLVSFDSARRAYDYLAALPPEQRPDALVSDIAMPDEDGYSFIRRVRSLAAGSNRPRMVALALTAFARDEDRARSMSAGFDVHIGKPIDSAILVETLRSALTHKRSAPATHR